ncbi:hypothetical protein HDV00_000831 [Rhizophlyctis rosea]|nr:hypothetical protein HDV00_000831 [Rhizophlyctis rosea]
MLRRSLCVNARRGHFTRRADLSQPTTNPTLTSIRTYATPSDSDSSSPQPPPTPTPRPITLSSSSTRNPTNPPPQPTDFLSTIPSPAREPKKPSDLLAALASIIDKTDKDKPTTPQPFKPSSTQTPQSSSSLFSRTPVRDLLGFSDHLPYMVHINAGRNNTLAVLTAPDGKVITTSSAGIAGLRKSARGTTDAGYQAVHMLTERVAAKKDGIKGYSAAEIEAGVQRGVHLALKGFGPGREQALRAIMAAGWSVSRVTDRTGIKHGGNRARKPRRL